MLGIYRKDFAKTIDSIHLHRRWFMTQQVYKQVQVSSALVSHISNDKINEKDRKKKKKKRRKKRERETGKSKGSK